MRARPRTAFARLAVAVAAALALASCGLFRGAVNSSPGLRWWLFSNFGAQRMCPEMLKRGAPLKLVPNGNTIGRFFPTSCQHAVSEASQTVTIQFAGTGYAWTPLAGRMGFSMEASVEYRPDFQLTDDADYVFARFNRVVDGPRFSIGAVENPLVDWATSSTPAGYLANTFAGQIVQGQLASGFTVVRTDEGDDFTLGILTPPARPQHPFKAREDRMSLVNEIVEVRAGQTDFVGPLEVADDDQSLYLRFRVTGPPMDALVFPRDVAEPFREALQRGVPIAAPAPGLAAATLVVNPGEVEQKHKLRLRPGQYYLLLDNSNRIGQIQPAWNPVGLLGGGAAIVSVSVDLGD